MAKILVAEDDESMLNFLVLALQRAGHEVTPTSNGLDALSMITQGNTYDLLLTDIVMPGMDGVELAKKTSEITPDTKVMFITGFAAMAMETAEKNGKKRPKLLSKPFHLNDLVQQVDQVLAD